MSLGIHISELLFRYDCVIIPGFGGFVGNYAPARLHPVQHRFYPPSKKITFNRNLQNNDGLLANLISQKENCSYELAVQNIQQIVTNFEHKLGKQERITLEKVGSFFYDLEGNLQFEPDLKTNYLLDSYGLRTFQSLPIERKHTPDVEIPEERKIALAKYAKITAAASLFFALLWIPLKTDLLKEMGVDQSSLNPFSKKEAAIYSSKASGITLDVLNKEHKLSDQVSENISFIKWSFLHENELSENTPKQVLIRLEEKKKIETVLPVNTAVNKNTVIELPQYHVVGGCFEFKKNANKLVRRLKRKGYSAIISGKRNNLYVVSYGSFSSRTEAVELLNSVKNQDNSQAWLLRN